MPLRWAKLTFVVIGDYQVAQEVLQYQVSLNPDQIRELASRINSTLLGLQNIDDILIETEESRKRAKELNSSAVDAAYVPT